jgi:hypothetical protein
MINVFDGREERKYACSAEKQLILSGKKHRFLNLFFMIGDPKRDFLSIGEIQLTF